MKPMAINLGGTGVLAPPSLVGVMVLMDRSGSMHTIKEPMEQAFADFVTMQRTQQPDGLWLTLHQFDGQGYDVVYDRTALAEVGALQLKPRGSTPLKEALWRFGLEARRIIDDPEDETERLLLLIVTDGQNTDQSSHSWAQIRELFEGLASEECETIWLGTTAALIEAQEQLPAFATAGSTVQYAPDSAGVKYAGENITCSVSAFRTGRSARQASAQYADTATALHLRMTDKKAGV